jgi:hypothetical protein
MSAMPILKKGVNMIRALAQRYRQQAHCRRGIGHNRLTLDGVGLNQPFICRTGRAQMQADIK